MDTSLVARSSKSATAAAANRVPIARCQTVDDLEALPPAQQSVIEDYEVVQANVSGVRDGHMETVRRVRTTPRIKALDLLAKHHGLCAEHVHVGADERLLAILDAGRLRNAQREPDPEEGG